MALFDGAVPRPGFFDKCPKCGLDFPDPVPSCDRCGIVFAKWKAPVSRAPSAWEYTVMQGPMPLVVKEEDLPKGTVAAWFNEAIFTATKDGWEFVSIENVPVSLNVKSSLITRDNVAPTLCPLIIFRRPRA